ncbi:hypothetical protein SAMN04488095_1491 [Jannaschia pohangensis]|uniref:Uncharacterized protein n=1 Tax=Jannaschia pohangensis TaxID=390807 RepID=A0A1I3JZZ1_9RHOB|nr:hypothetical protein SAMN04488095_1491 [Jannaschia pohangensis]
MKIGATFEANMSNDDEYHCEIVLNLTGLTPDVHPAETRAGV